MIHRLGRSVIIPSTFLLLFACGGICQQRRAMKEVDVAGLRNAIAAHKGKVVFVNFWATWCSPCVAEFPDIVRLYQKYHSGGLEVIAVSFDPDAPTALPFLNRQKADFINLLRSPRLEDDAFITGFDKQAAGALPITWIFDRRGLKKYFTIGKFDPAAAEKLIADLLARK